MKTKNKFQPKINNCAICDDEYFQSNYNLTRCEKCKAEGLKRCQKHDAVILGKHKSCPKCSLEKSIQKYTEENKDDWVECPLCGYRAGDLGQHIIKHHNMTTGEFRQITGFVSIKSKNQRERVVGDKNPAYQHGGKFSPFSEKFINADKVDADEVKKKASKSRKDNDGNSTTIEYWLKKTDGNLEEAQNLLTERQSTFSLEKCIEKYGENAGLDKWVKRQEKWLKSYNNKSEEEMLEINRKKSNNLSFSMLWSNESTQNGIFYILHLKNNYYKIGITTKSVKQRYGKNKNYTILKEYKSTINHCFQIEQLLKKNFKDCCINKIDQIDEFGWTETFDIKNINELYDYVEVLYKSPNSTTTNFIKEFNIKNEANFI